MAHSATANAAPDYTTGALHEVRNLIEGVRRTVARHGECIAIRTLDDSISWTYLELLSKAEAAAKGLYELGVRSGHTIALMLGNRPEFQLCDLAAVLLGATPFSIYQSNPVGQIEYVLRNSDARVLVTESVFLPQVHAAVARLGHDVQIVLVDGSEDRCISLRELVAIGHPSAVDLAAIEAQIDHHTLCTIIYTSGTTGVPKGVEITHGNVLASARDFPSRVTLDHTSRIIGWLPAAHVAERIVSYYMPLLFGSSVTSCPDVKQIGHYLATVRPTYFMGVPRIWEKLQGGIQALWAASPEGPAIAHALRLGRERTRLQQAGARVPGALAAELADADKRFFAPVRRALGLDALVTAHIGSAPAPDDLIVFYHSIGIPLAEVWGMSETTGAGISNPPDAIRIGTVGLPTAGIETRLAADGELLIRSDVVTRGYRGMPAETAETIIDGWLHTGDLAEQDDDGYVRLIGRKKEIIINAAGKNISPAMIEAQVKSATPLISQACCVGEGRPYNVAILVLDPDYAPQWAVERGIESATLEALSVHPLVIEELERAIVAANTRLSRPEQIKKFYVCPTDWLPAGDELTPTMKLKRPAILDKYAEKIELLYMSAASLEPPGT